MADPFHILLSGHAEEDLVPVATALQALPGVEVQTRVLKGGEHDPIGTGATPSLLIHFLGDSAERELASLIERPARLRPELLVIGAVAGDAPRIMRMAMQAGAHDFITYPVVAEEIVAEVRALLKQHEGDPAQTSTLTAFLSPKGGGGASTVAATVAQALVTRLNLPTLLMDLDCQFGTQYLNLDLKPDKGLKEALDVADTLDEIALRAYVGQHASGLHVIGTLPAQILLPGEVTEKALYRLLELMMHSYSQIVVDLPCTIDSTFSLIIEKMRHVVLVVQQDFQNIRNGQKMVHILRDELQVPIERIACVINRYEPNNSITTRDVEQALQLHAMGVIPSDFRSVNDAANLGIPLLAHAPKSPVATAAGRLAEWVSGHVSEPEEPSSLLGKFRAVLSGKA